MFIGHSTVMPAALLAASDLSRSPSWRALGGDRALQEAQALEARHGSTTAACKALGL